MYEDEDGSEELPRSSFSIYVAEGDVLFKQGEYKKALDSYNTALEIEPSDKGCLVARSKCYLQLGDSQAALRDAESALSEDKEFIKGLYQKAEALYQMGDFEMALVFYHRGHKLRTELEEFRLGIQKAQEAIDNSVGSPAKVKLENKGDLSFFYKQDEKQPKGKAKPGYSKPAAKQDDRGKQKDRRQKSQTSDKTCKQLLGELYSDKEYLERLLKDNDLTNQDTESGQKIYDLVNDGLHYLDTRTDFWRQQKPMYARKRDKEEGKGKSKDKQKPSNPTSYVLKKLDEVDEALAEGRPEDALKLSQQTMSTVKKLNEEDLSESSKPDVMGNLHSCMGNAYLDMGKMDQALDHHRKDLDIAEKNDLSDAQSRALDNLGRVYARIGRFQEAIDAWEKKLPLSKAPLESTWLYHEIGRCYLEIDKFEQAHEYGEKSMSAAQEAEDDTWQLNASVLIAQSEVKLGDLQAAIDSFERSLEMAKLQGDEAAQQAITKAIEDVNNKIVEGIKEGDEDENKEVDESEEHQEDEEKVDEEKPVEQASDEKDEDESENKPEWSNLAKEQVDEED
ncbi:outer dynein arm-docking complex subunit 4-like [Saccoglossus kowalevskii]|uniref:Outer dynein arm-docking complex subunit 4 n=1 Tax=Saccoglossus kowalevskii TaxID=10224 RepID=A0ABM0GXP3_SACKO|nr:PREDICTED: tetratricopeptide repeat protein 25-like isoform X1 [Saccoglossus kowalevskii]